MLGKSTASLLVLAILGVTGCGLSKQTSHHSSNHTSVAQLHNVSVISMPNSVYVNSTTNFNDKRANSSQGLNSQQSKPKVVLPSVAMQQQYLSELGYLPFKLSKGKLQWKYALPKSLTSKWVYGKWNDLYHGALIQFQHESKITSDGVFGPKTWAKMQFALQHGILDHNSYSYISVSKGSPETLTLYYNGHVKLKSLVNTGIIGAQTPDGTYPIYLRYRSQTMRGTDPNGTHYSDVGVPYVNYFYKGDAVHGFKRSHYGYPQSNGCVELPYSKAAVVWKYVNYGTLVTIS